MNQIYDAAIIGGGTAGVVAAIQAARAGVRTLLVEKSTLLGGTVTNAMVNCPGLFHAWTKQIIAGIGWELVEQCIKEDGGSMPDFSLQPDDVGHWKYQIGINASLYAMLCDEAVVKSGAEVKLGTMIAAVREDENTKHLTLCTKDGLEEVDCRVLIDCTGDANAVSLAGYPVVRGEERQPATYCCRLAGYEPDKVDFEELRAAYDREVAAGRLKYTDIGWDADRMTTRFLDTLGNNSNHIEVMDVYPDTASGRTAYDLEGRAAVLRVYRFLKEHKGFENLHITQLATECGIRESVRIEGKKIVTKEAFLSAHRYGDDLCYTYYPIDVHTGHGGGLEQIFLKKGNLPTIPRGALLPKGSRNLLVAGRTVSSDREANSAIRVQATCMAEGQAAGALAALACLHHVDVEEVDIQALYTLLEKHGAIVPRDR